MINILNQAYLALDQYLNTKKFDTIVDDIIIGIAKSKYASGPTNPGPGYVDKQKKSVSEIYSLILHDSNHPYHNTIKNLKNWEPLTFIQYKWPSHSLGQCLVLRQSESNNYSTKGKSSKCSDQPIMSNFTSFMKWLEEENIFDEIGRIVIFLNEPGSCSIEHKDYVDGISRKDQFVWICPLGNKKFYVRDDTEKVYLKSRFCYFDNANIHGSDPAEQNTFSIRVDGIFSKSFLDKTNLGKHL
jgi:hypothetical protein